jgi:hypothetical protein
VELDKYLANVYLPRCQGEAAERRAQKRFRDVSTHGSVAWDKVAALFRRTAHAVNQVGVKLAAITPPEELAEAHAPYAAGWFIDGATYTDLATELTHHDQPDWGDFNTRFRQTEEAVTHYRMALTAYAAKYHLKLPPWVQHIDN